MIQKLIYSKHTPSERCGLAYFSQRLAEKIGGTHISDFHGLGACEELYINMDIYELNESEISSLIKFVSSESTKKTILLMHDYRFSHFEDQLVNICDAVVNLSGETALTKLSPKKTIDLFTPSIVEPPFFKFTKQNKKFLSLAFGFFHPRKKSFSMYVSFYEYMIRQYPNGHHIVIPSIHTGHNQTDTKVFTEIFHHNSIKVLDFVPGSILSELISAADLGVCFYPTGIMRNNATPMSFFSQGKTVITTYGDLTPADYPSFTLDAIKVKTYNFSDSGFLNENGEAARAYYEEHLSWEVFLKKLQTILSERK